MERSIKLRPYQVEGSQAAMRAWMRTTSRRQMVVLPTGTGKTILALHVVAQARERGHRVLWLAHREELLDQPSKTFKALWPDLAGESGIVQAHRDEWYRDLVFCSIDTLARERRLEAVLAAGPPRVVVVDECHHSAAGSWAKVLDAIDAAGKDAFRDTPGPDSPLYLGLTATPERADGKPLGKLWRVAYSYPIPKAIEDGYLVPPNFAVERLDLDLSKIATRAGDWADDQLEDALLQAEIVEHTVEAMGEHAQGRKSLIFTVTVNQATLTAEALKEAGLRAEVVSGETPKAQRRELLQGLRAGRLDALCNCAVLTEGYDDPSVDAIVLARPTRSHPLFVQMVGRGLRLHPGKRDCLVVDLVGASEEHDLITSSALLTVEQQQGEGKAPEGEQERRSKWAAFLEEGRGRSKFAWAQIPDVSPVAFALNAGGEGTAALVEQDGGFLAVILRKGGEIDYPAGKYPLDHETAQGCAEDFVRQAEAATIAGRAQPWRRQRTSSSQRDLLARLRIDTVPATRGEAEKLITGKLAQGRLVRHGLVRRHSKATQMELSA